MPTSCGARRRILRDNLRRLVGHLRLVPDVFGPPPAGVRLPAKDVPILATSALAEAEFLVTGDEDFGQYFGRAVGGVTIILPRHLAAVLTT